jgi:hypothetical protein
MSAPLVLVTILIYAVAGYLLWRERSFRYLLLLLAGHLAMLLTPLWQWLFAIQPPLGEGLSLLGRFEIPWSVIVGGGPLLALPPLIFYYGVRHRWWPRHYVAVWTAYLVLIIYFLLVEGVLERSGAVFFGDGLSVANTIIPSQLIQALLLAGVSLGMLYTVVSTRHFGLEIAAGLLLVSGIASALLFIGIFASPLWVGRFLGQNELLSAGGAIVSLMLVLWGVHLLASGTHAGRRQQFVWR